MVSEEQEKQSYEIRKHHPTLWMVDPIDGTKEFTQRNGEFTVNIALIHDRQPVFGIVTAPAIQQAYVGWKQRGAWKTNQLHLLYPLSDTITSKSYCEAAEKIHTRSHSSKPAMAVSRSHFSEASLHMIHHLFGQDSGLEKVHIGSSLKFCLLAEGKAQYYGRPDIINEWDTAAGHAVLCAAGGALATYPEGRELYYNKENLKTPGFIACYSNQELQRLKRKLSL